MIELPLSVSIAGLEPGAGRAWCRADGAVDARRAIEWVAGLGKTRGVRAIQLDGTLAGIRARDLDRSGRRDVAAMLRRAGLELSGADLFIPASHFVESAHVDRAVRAVAGAAELLAELAGLVATRKVVSLVLPVGGSVSSVLGLERMEQEFGVRVADHAVGEGSARVEPLGVGVDPAALLLAGHEPGKIVSRLGGAPLSARLSDASEVGRVGVGLGRLDALAYGVALHTAGYVGPVVVDLRGVRDQDHARVGWPGGME